MNKLYGYVDKKGRPMGLLEELANEKRIQAGRTLDAKTARALYYTASFLDTTAFRYFKKNIRYVA